MKCLLRACLTATGLLALLVASATTLFAQEGGTPPPPRSIPGITADDRFPGGCVDCHVNYTEMNMDTRISTLMATWTKQVDAPLLARFQSFSPARMKLKGKHPSVAGALKDIPNSCLKCHGKTSKSAPPFGSLIHGVHLVGGAENHFLTVFQGECTHCHKLDAASGTWRFPSGPEK